MALPASCWLAVSVVVVVQLSNFQKLLVLRVLREEKLVFGTRK